jgi:hypothetical protein
MQCSNHHDDPHDSEKKKAGSKELGRRGRPGRGKSCSSASAGLLVTGRAPQKKTGRGDDDHLATAVPGLLGKT